MANIIWDFTTLDNLHVKIDCKEVSGNMKNLKIITCDPSCGFSLTSHDKSELMKIAKSHARNYHKDMKVTEKMIESMIKPVRKNG